MKTAVYAELQQALLQDNKKALEKYPWVEFDTVVAIKSQESSRQIRMQHHKFRSRQRIQEFISSTLNPPIYESIKLTGCLVDVYTQANPQSPIGARDMVVKSMDAQHLDPFLHS